MHRRDQQNAQDPGNGGIYDRLSLDIMQTLPLLGKVSVYITFIASSYGMICQIRTRVNITLIYLLHK